MTNVLLMSIAIVAISTAFQHGYNIGVVNAPEQQIINWILNIPEYRTITMNEATVLFSIFNTMLSVGALLSALMTNNVTNKFGRKKVIIGINVLSVIAGPLHVVAVKYYMSFKLFCLARFIVGLSAGISASLGPMYLVEIAPLKIRGSCGALYQVVINVSLLLASIVGTDWFLGNDSSWCLIFIIPSMVGLVMGGLACVIPETPQFLLMEKKEDAALRSLEKLRDSRDGHIMAEFEAMKQEMKAEKWTGIKYLVHIMLSPSLRTPLLISVMIMMSQQFSGINCIMFYSAIIFRDAGLTGAATYGANIGLMALNSVFSSFTIGLVEKLGRKPLLLIGTMGMSTSMVILAISMMIQLPPWVSSSSLFLFIAFFAIGPGPVPWLITGELVPIEARGYATTFVTASNWFGTIVISAGFPALNSQMGYGVFFLFASLNLAFFFYILKRLPETKNRPVEEIRNLFSHETEKPDKIRGVDYIKGRMRMSFRNKWNQDQSIFGLQSVNEPENVFPRRKFHRKNEPVNVIPTIA